VRECQEVVDQPAHAIDGALDERQVFGGLRIERAGGGILK
jgi:hypothetical protein